VSSIDSAAEADIVIEAIVEDVSAKQKLFSALEMVVRTDCVVATNTSSLSVSAIASACERSGRVIGTHFFNPAPLLPLVEVIPALQSERSIVDAVVALLDSWGKVPVVARDLPGFIVNRVARPFYGEAIRILDEGIADCASIDWAMTDLGGFRMGPFELMDLIGNDVNYAVTSSVYEAFYHDPRYRPSTTQQRMVQSGRLGRKSGRGYYDYSNGAELPRSSIDEILGRTILDRIVAMLMNEAADAVFWNVASPGDIDLAMQRGVNYPRGLLEWVDDVGPQWVIDRVSELGRRYEEDRYRTSPILKDLASTGGRFHG
jgi:3-hydroxybutyryl-CoA dehydrogenase